MNKADENNKTDLGEYLKTLSDAQGCSVVTVKDGWVFVFKKDMLTKLLQDADNDTVAIFVKSSANQPKN